MDRRRALVGVAVAGAALVLAACGSSDHAATAPKATGLGYGPTGGAPLDAAGVRRLERTAPGMPRWAKVPTIAAGARVLARHALVVPLRGGKGWCLGQIFRGAPQIAWCTPASGPRHAIEAGLVFATTSRPSHGTSILVRAARPAVRIRVTLAGGTRVTVPLRHGVAFAPIASSYAPSFRPTTVSALAASGRALVTRSLGWPLARWRANGPKTPAQLRSMEKRLLRHPPPVKPPCTGTIHSNDESEFVVAWSDTSDSPVVATILPTGLGTYGGDLYVTSSTRTTAVLVDAAGTHRRLDLGPGNCAYVRLTARLRARPFHIAWRTAAGRRGVTSLGDWAGFPTD
jgi:hypothetical protein